jgi:hypothetical protein
MLTRRIIAATFFLATASSAALAAATADEAARITASLQTYLGSEPGVVTVAPQGDDYLVTLNAAPYLAKITQPGVKVTMDPVVLTVRPKGNGQWDVSQKGSYGLGWWTACPLWTCAWPNRTGRVCSMKHRPHS